MLVTAALVMMCMTFANADTTSASSEITKTIGEKAGPYVYLAIRLVGAVLGIAGLFIGIKGFTSDREGKDKIEQIATGLITLGIGIWMVSKADTVIGLVGLNEFLNFSDK